MNKPTANQRIVLLGAGNVATHLGVALQQKGFPIVQVYSRTRQSAQELGEKLHTDFTTDLSAINPDADIYIFSVKDAVLPELLDEMDDFSGLFVHTAGSVPLSVFEGHASRFGVLYPLQTFSKNRVLTFDHIPIFVEANFKEDENLLKEVAAQLSQRVIPLSSEKRKYLHLAAVFACNFTNHMYALSSEILEENNLDGSLLSPLIEETAAKIKELHPKEAQTGPAVRYDKGVIDRHLSMLNGDKAAIYEIVSKSIHRRSQ